MPETIKFLDVKLMILDKLEEFIPAKKETIIGGLEFLDDFIVRSEKSDAIPKFFVRNIKTNEEEEIKISDEAIGCPGISLMQKNRNTSKIRVGWESMKTPSKIYEYNILTKKKNLLKKLKYLQVIIQINI